MNNLDPSDLSLTRVRAKKKTEIKTMKKVIKSCQKKGSS